MSQRFHLIDPNKAYDQLLAEIGRRKARLMVLKLVLESLKGMEGKPLTWHVAKALSKKHPHQKFEFDKTYSWYSLTITGEGMSGLSLNLGYKGSVQGVTYQTIVDNNQAYLLDEERIPRMQSELKNIEERVNRYNAALIELKRAREELGEGSYAFTEDTSISLEDANGRWYSE